MINLIANRYAEALFQIGEEENITTELYSELKEVVNIIKVNREFYNILKAPFISKSEKKDLIEGVFAGKIDNNLKNFLKILVDKDRVTSLEAIQKCYKELLNEKNNLIEGVAITAIPMETKEIKELESKLSSKYNKNVTLNNIVDETVLGGVLVRLGNEEIDGTIKTRLSNMREQLSQVIS